jgi:ubiquinone/menaquinone biosynthesis C-methylase UbiE
MEDNAERVDVRGRPRDHVQLAHRCRYLWALPRIQGDILDVACGTGHGAELLARRGRVAGVDRSPEAISVARARLPEGDFTIADVPPIPYNGGTFQAVVCFETIEHLADDRGFLDEIRRVMKPGGALLLSTPNRSTYSPGGTNPWHEREYLLGELTTLLGEAGFRPVGIYCQGEQTAGFVHKTAFRLVSRLPTLCQVTPLSYYAGKVLLWDRRSEPSIWILEARLTAGRTAPSAAR